MLHGFLVKHTPKWMVTLGSKISHFWPQSIQGSSMAKRFLYLTQSVDAFLDRSLIEGHNTMIEELIRKQ
jgi:hypothetical protein